MIFRASSSIQMEKKMINRISTIQPNRMQTPQNKPAKLAFGTTSYSDGNPSLIERPIIFKLTPEQESEVIADLTKKASKGDLKIDTIFPFGDKAFKSKDGDWVVLIHKTKLNSPHISWSSNDFHKFIDIDKDDKMTDNAKKSYNLLEQALDNIKPNTQK